MCSEYKTYLPKNFKYREVEKIRVLCKRLCLCTLSPSYSRGGVFRPPYRR